MPEQLDVSSPRTIGSLGEVGAIAFGCWRLTGTDSENAAVVSAAVDAGMTLIDNADVYGLDWAALILVRAKKLSGASLQVLLDYAIALPSQQRGHHPRCSV